MARSNEGTNADPPALPDQKGWRHWGDGLAGRIHAARIQGFYPTAADYRDVQVDANGVIQTTGGAGGGGAATIADGADVAQGTTTDTSSANTVIGLLKAVKAALTGTLTTSATVSNFPATQPVSLATNTPDVTDRVARLLGHVTVDNASIPVTGTFFQVTQPVSAAVLPLPAGASTDATLTAAVGSATDTPSAFTVLDQLTRIRKQEEANGKALQQLIALQTPVVARKTQPTLLHRS